MIGWLVHSSQVDLILFSLSVGASWNRVTRVIVLYCFLIEEKLSSVSCSARHCMIVTKTSPKLTSSLSLNAWLNHLSSLSWNCTLIVRSEIYDETNRKTTLALAIVRSEIYDETNRKTTLALAIVRSEIYDETNRKTTVALAIVKSEIYDETNRKTT